MGAHGGDGRSYKHCFLDACSAFSVAGITKFRAQDRRRVDKYFGFSMGACVLGVHCRCLGELLLMGTHNICFFCGNRK